jgi:hypothetical protein
MVLSNAPAISSYVTIISFGIPVIKSRPLTANGLGGFSNSVKADPTSILIDDLVKVVYLNGLDQVYFDRAINRIV